MLYPSKTNKVLYLSGDTPLNYSLSGIYAPFSLTIDPRNIQTIKKIRKIEYIWGDGTTDIVNYIPIPSTATNDNLPYKNDVGSPLNYSKTKNFYSKDLNLSIYNIIINFYCFTVNNPVSSFNLTLNINNPDMATRYNSFFSEIHLLKTKMYGPDDKILYTFQSENEEYILMTNVNWKLKPIPILSNNKSLSLPYKNLKPFETNYTSNKTINALPNNNIIN
jgi:hypothetical protein